jgi:hypothetical protein
MNACLADGSRARRQPHLVDAKCAELEGCHTVETLYRGLDRNVIRITNVRHDADTDAIAVRIYETGQSFSEIHAGGHCRAGALRLTLYRPAIC